MNPASRLLELYDSLSSAGDRESMLNIWAARFDLPKEDPDVSDQVEICLMALRDELTLTASLLKDKDVPERLFASSFSSLRSVASPRHLGNHWEQIRGNIAQPDVRQSLAWASWLLQDADEDRAEMLEELALALSALEAEVHAIEGTYLRQFTQKQIDRLRMALRLYKIQGVAPLRENLHHAAGQFILERAKLERAFESAPSATVEAFKKVAELVEDAAEIVDRVDKVDKLKGTGIAAYTTMTQLLPFIQ